MEAAEQIILPIADLQAKTYSYDYLLNEAFFNSFQNDELSKPAVKLKIELHKRPALLQFDLHFSGTIELVCDRSLELFSNPVKFSHSLYYKFGEEEGEESEDVFVILPSTHQIDLTQHVYDLLVLSLPVKKLHPKFAESDSGEDELIYTSGEDTTPDPADSATDPRWEKLKNLGKN